MKKLTLITFLSLNLSSCAVSKQTHVLHVPFYYANGTVRDMPLCVTSNVKLSKKKLSNVKLSNEKQLAFEKVLISQNLDTLACVIGHP